MGYTPPLWESKIGSQDRNLKAHIEAETVREYCLHACSPVFVKVPAYIGHNQLSWDASAHRGMGIFISNQ